MKQNTAGQVVGVQLVNAADNTAFTGSASVFVTLDDGTQAAGTETAPVSEGNGYHTYIPSQAETNAATLAFTFTGSGAKPETIRYDTTWSQSGDNFVRLGVPADTDIATDIANVQSSVGNIAVGSASISTPASDYTLTVGNLSSGLYTDTETLNSIYHIHTDAAGALDLYYEFDVTGAGVGTEVTVVGRINGSNDSLDGVYVWDWIGSSWDRIGDFEGQVSAVDVTRNYSILTRHTGTGVNLGKIRFRFFSASGLTTSTLNVDQLYASYAVVSQTVGYANGSIWIDTINGTAGVEAYVNGTADNPVDSLADSITLKAAIGLSSFQVVNGSSIVFAESHVNETWKGENWSLVLGGQDISGTFIANAILSGVATATSPPNISHCKIDDITLPPCAVNGGSGFNGTVTLGSAGEYAFIDCNSLVAGSSSPILDLGALVGPIDMSIRGWQGGLEILNILAGDVISLEGVGGTIEVDGTGGTIHTRGIFEDVIDNSSAAVEIVQTAMLNRASLAGYDDGAVYLDTNSPSAGVILYVDGTADNPVNNLADATTIAGNVGGGIKKLSLSKGTAITLAQGYPSWVFTGDGGNIDLGGQDVGRASFDRGAVFGIGTGANPSFYEDTRVINLSIPTAAFTRCAMVGTLSITGVGETSFKDCYSASAGFILDFAAAGDISANLLQHTGAIEIQNMTAGDTLIMVGGVDLTFNASCTGGTASLIGEFILTDNGAVTITKDDNTTDIELIPATVNAEVLDVLTVDTFAEPTSAVAATASIKDMLNWLKTVMRNKAVQTATLLSLRNDADNADISTADVDDDGTTFTRDKHV